MTSPLRRKRPTTARGPSTPAPTAVNADKETRRPGDKETGGILSVSWSPGLLVSLSVFLLAAGPAPAQGPSLVPPPAPSPYAPITMPPPVVDLSPSVPPPP